MIRNSQPMTWHPKGISDSLDGSLTFNGAMASLGNLIPDPSTSGLWQCRPAATKLIDITVAVSGGFFTGTPGVISVFRIVGNIVYGLCGETVSGNDKPFAFNLATSVFLTVMGVTGTNVPQSLPTTGAWTPPIMDVIGSKLVVTHLGFAAGANFIGWFDISTPTAPVWHAGNLTGAITFAQPPSAVAQFNNRAYYIVNTLAQPALVFSDSLNATNVTAATQSLTFGDLVPLTALGQLRLYNQLGGIIQALIVFKDSVNTYQITGDAALNNLAINAMNFATGTKAPNTVCSTPKGLAFVAPDGMRIIDFQANISDPIGVDGQGICVPFIYASVPTRMCAACNGDTIRLTTKNANNAVAQEYWYHISRGVWSGPHTFPAALIQPFAGSFLLTGVGISAVIWQSDVQQSAISVFVENGVQLNWTYVTALLPDTDTMTNFMIAQATLDLALSASSPAVSVIALDQNGSVVDSVSLSITGAGTLWGSFNWGGASWGFPALALAPRQLPWHFPLVLARGQFSVMGQSSAQSKIGALRLRYKELKYLTDIAAAA